MVKESGPAKECGIAKRLQKPLSADFKDAPFRQIVQDLREWSGINICLDEVSLKEEGVDLDHPVTLKLEGVSLKSALNLLTKPLHLKCAVRDGALHITTEPSGSPKLPGGVSCPASYMPVTTFVTPIFEGGAIGKPVPVTRYVPCPGDGAACGASAAQPACADPRRTASCPSGLAESSAQAKCCPPSTQAEGTRPVHERCYAGGLRIMRGFQLPEVVPGAQACQIGGDSMLHTLEYQVPGFGNDRLYRVTFVDSGTVGCNAEVQEQRVSAGAGIRIVVPMLGPVPIAVDFGFPIEKPETAQATPEPLPPPQCSPPPTPSSSEVHSAKTEPAKTCGCCTCCPKCCESKTKQKRARIRVIAPPPAPVTYVPTPLVPSLMPWRPAVGVMAAPMVVAPMLVPPPAAVTTAVPPATVIYSQLSWDVMKQCKFARRVPLPVPLGMPLTTPVAPPAPLTTLAWTMQVAKEDGHDCLEFHSGRDTRGTCQQMSLKMSHGDHLKIATHDKQIHISGPGLEAAADRITKWEAAEHIVLEGHVRVKYHKDCVAEITAEHVVIDMKDGYLSLKLAAPKGEDPATAKKEKLFNFWIGMFQ